MLPFWHELFGLLAAISWPVALFWIANAYKDEIRKLIPRLRKAGTSGVEFAAGDGQENIGPAPQLTISTGQSENILRPPAVATVEGPIRDDLVNYAPDKVIDHLVTALARERLDRVFMLAYSNIFSSQIQLLKAISNSGGEVSQKYTEDFFEELKRDDEAFAEWELPRYLNFLMYFKLIMVSDDGYSITDFGSDFLIFLARYGLSTDRGH